MDIYIIILNFNTYQDTINLVNQLQNQKQVTLKIIVVDNHSPNFSFEILKDTFVNTTNVTVLDSGKNGGYSFGNNVGLKYIKQFNPKFVAVLNNDIIIHNEYLLFNLLEEFKKYNKAVLCAPSMHINGSEKNSAWKIPTYRDLLIEATRTGQFLFKKRIQYIFPKEKKTEKVECLAGSFFIADYNKFNSLGFFDEELFLFGEETILAQKIKQTGGINLLCRQYSYDHLWSKSIGTEVGKIKRIKLQLRGREVLLKKYLNTNLFLTGIIKMLHELRILEERLRLIILNFLVFVKNKATKLTPNVNDQLNRKRL